MEITVALIITALTLVAGEVTKLFNLNTKYIPIQNIIIAVLASIICIAFKVQDMGILETILTCIFGTMSAGGIYDLTKTKGAWNYGRYSRNNGIIRTR